MNRFLVLLILFLKTFCADSFCLAQDNSPIPPPKAPFVVKPPPRSGWSIDISKVKEHQNPPPKDEKQAVLPSRLEIQVDEDRNEHCVITYTDQSQLTFYIFGGQVMDKASNSSKIVAWTPEDGGRNFSVNKIFTTSRMQHDLRRADFPATFWISAQNYTGIEKVGLIPCYRYETSQGEKALIEADTLTPLTITSEGETYVFTRQSGPNGKIPIPSEYQAVLEKASQEAQAMKAMRRSNLP